MENGFCLFTRSSYSKLPLCHNCINHVYCDDNIIFSPLLMLLFDWLVFQQIVFADAWWIGQKEENPQELQLEFPKYLSEVISYNSFTFILFSFCILMVLDFIVAFNILSSREKMQQTMTSKEVLVPQLGNNQLEINL